MVESEINLACLVSHPIQYQAPLFSEVNERSGVSLTVYFCSRQGARKEVDSGFGQEVVWDVPLLEGYDYEFLNDVSPVGGAESFFRLNPGIINAIRDDRPDVLWVHGYEAMTNCMAILAANYFDVPVILRGEGTLIHSGNIVSTAKDAVLKRLFRSVSGFAYIGAANKSFYQSLGVPGDKLFFSPYSVDNDYFQMRRDELPDKDALRDTEVIPSDATVILFVGKLIGRKRPSLLLEAFLQATSSGDAILMFVGDGEQRANLESKVPRGRVSDVRFAGFVNQSELSRYYKLADVFCLPSARENWGLVINEAMNFGLPVITTSVVGAAVDLVNEENGYVVPADNVSALSGSIDEILSRSDSNHLGARSEERIKNWGIEEAADGIVKATNAIGKSIE